GMGGRDAGAGVPGDIPPRRLTLRLDEGQVMGAAGRKLSFIEQARRRQIIDAAVEVIAEHGPAGATFARIAERAEISPALISYHFASKAQLMSQVAGSIIEAMDAAITAEIGEAE